MAHRQNKPAQQKNYDIVLKALPGNFSESKAMELFEQHDQIIDFFMPKEPYKPRSRKVGPKTGLASAGEKPIVATGYCYITFRRRETALQILGLGSIKLGDRLLNVEAFISDKESRELNNQRNNRRKIIAKNLPPELSSSEAVKCFFQRYGPIENAHVIANNEDPTIPPTTADIFFKMEATAEHLLTYSKQIRFGASDHFITVEIYIPKKDRLKKKLRQTGDVLPHHSHVFEPGNLFKSRPGRSDVPSQHEVFRTDVPVHVSSLQSPGDEPEPEALGDAPELGAPATLNFTAASHRVKPTSKSYHQITNEQYKQYHCTTNLRFNNSFPPRRQQPAQAVLPQQHIL